MWFNLETVTVRLYTKQIPQK
uniref:Uncharacterized protein n=1 Tax=Anguilla anguilla TaxID=7936 RepID=A0A0E9UY49_ANGAN